MRKEGYHTITRNGHPVVVIVSQEEFEQYQIPGDTLIDFFQRAPFLADDLHLVRDKDVGREVKL